ncbi:MAG TPA: enoyl-CoA hydratase/isomerase family protein [Desulfomonilia bacterium]|nr:enoyl-CoA hydratase/isomerase family protein [Desulfomonilia bacterium]
MNMISVSCRDGIAVANLSRGVTNALNLDLVHELDEILDKVEHDSGIRGLVLGSGSDKFFSIGFDIQQMFDFSREDFETFFRAFNDVCLRLYTLPKPTAAAITGHAVAGGCIMVLCCDYRFISDGKKYMGLNEIRLGVPVPYLADCILRDLAGTCAAQEIMETGRFYEPVESLRVGLVDEVAPSGEVSDRACEKVKSAGGWPPKAFAAIKRNRTEEIAKRVRNLQEAKHREFIDCWYSSDARALIREAMKRF